MAAKHRLWHLGWARYGTMANSLASMVKAKGTKFDIVIGIARGGIPLAMVIADAIEVRMDIINVKSYTGIRQRGKPMILSTLTSGIKGKRVLLVDDLIEEGETMHTVLGFLSKEKPLEIRTAVLFKKPWSKFEPDFYLKVVDKWIVFPWDRFETRRIVNK